ncbi:folylpolyglutamate synthase isoform X3 [Ipomoea triloba]|uniref:folylpolyglutamate synthase isoform X3 n=1 Tax=Ipomoea triloba TaxID=35885 RepID=UPI00125DB40B|nr:folylpolyglutamate synthase isoform X3 [Ipomoea triloba]
MEKLNNEKVEETSQVKEVTSTYEYAMEKLSSLITRKKRDGKSTISEIEKRERMLSYIEILGLEKQIAGLKIIHVAGTKGKGSTCAFCEAILRECGFRTGLFTSPHLIDVRERFRLDGLDISEEKFLQYFWEIWNQLKDNIVEGLPMPPLFQFLTLLAFKIFASEKVDVAIIEVGIGGTFDSTNVIKEPVVCGITSLGMDHMEILGDTVGKIASHKAGILKLGVPAFTVPQPSEAMEVLYDRAQKLMVPLKVVTPLDSKVLKDVKLILSGDHQLTNAALAVSLCKSWLKTTGPRQLENADWDETLPHKFLIGLSSAHLSGRAQIVQDDTIKNSSGVNGSYPGGLTFYLDGAHSPESMEACARWFSAVVGENKNLSHLSSCSKDLTPKKIWVNGCIQDSDKQEPYKMSKQILLFNCMDVRDPQILLSRLVNTCTSSGTHFSKAIFVPSMSAYNKMFMF